MSGLGKRTIKAREGVDSREISVGQCARFADDFTRADRDDHGDALVSSRFRSAAFGRDLLALGVRVDFLKLLLLDHSLVIAALPIEGEGIPTGVPGMLLCHQRVNHFL